MVKREAETFDEYHSSSCVYLQLWGPNSVYPEQLYICGYGNENDKVTKDIGIDIKVDLTKIGYNDGDILTFSLDKENKVLDLFKKSQNEKTRHNLLEYTIFFCLDGYKC